MRVGGAVLLAVLIAVPVVGLDVALTARAAGAAITNYTDGSIGVVGGIVAGPDGALWFTNQDRNSIGRMDVSTHLVTAYTGTGISQPAGITAGPDGALWFTNQANNSIGRITTAGSVTNYTGTGISQPIGITAGPAGDPNSLWFTNQANNSIGRIDASTHVVTNDTGVGINTPTGITVGSDGELWFTNQANNSIGAITTGGSVSNWSDVTISNPGGIAAGSDGALWFTNQGNNSIGRIDTTGALSNFTGGTISTPVGIAAGADGALWFTNSGNGTIGRITTAGAVTANPGSRLSPTVITKGPDGAMWFANPGYSNVIGRITTPGMVSNYTDPSVVNPSSIVAGPDGAMWFTNYGTSSIGRIDPTTHAITSFLDASISAPLGIAVGSDGAMWFVNHGNDSIGRITTAGTVTNYTGSGISQPIGITAGPDGALWFTNYFNNSIGRIDASTHVVTNYTGTGISQPFGITAGPAGDPNSLWFANQGTNSIGRITTAGSVTNYTDLTISGPTGLVAGPDGALWFTNQNGNSIGRITTAGAVTHFTGTGLSLPYAITAGPDGALWFTNYSNTSIGRIDTAGTITTSADATISGATGIAAGPDGALWFANILNSSIGRVTATGGDVTRYGGQGPNAPGAIAAGSDGAMWFVNGEDHSISRMTTAGAVTNNYPVASAFRMTAGPAGDPNSLWFTDSENNRIGRITTSGAVSYYGDPSISNPTGIAVGSDGALWFTNHDSNSIGRIDPVTHVVTNYTFVGIDQPFDIAPGPDGALWFDQNLSGDSIGRIETNGNITMYESSLFAGGIGGLAAGPDGGLWAARLNGAILRIDPSDGSVTNTFTGPNINGPFDLTLGSDGAFYYFTQPADLGRITTDGTATSQPDPNMNNPASMAAGPDSAVWYTNASNNSVGRADVGGVANAPTGVSGTRGNGQVSLSWTAPANNGGFTLSDYSVSVFGGSGGTATGVTGATTRLVGSATTNFVFSGLTNGTAYTFKVAAVNSAGTGTLSALSAPVTPATVPGAPTGASAVAGVGSARVSFTAPASNGGSPITQFDVSCTSSNGGVSGARSGSASPLTVIGLSTAKQYSCTVTATNTVGTGSASSASNSISVAGSKVIPVGKLPAAVASDGTHVWIANVSDNTVTELDASDGSVVQTIGVDSNPDAVSADGTHVWVANGGDNDVTELNASDGSVVRTIGVGQAPTGISSDGTHVWVANSHGNSVLELNTSDGSIVGQFGTIIVPYAVSSDGTHVWVTDSTHNNVEEVNASDRSHVQTIATGSPAAVSSDGTHAWVANYSSGDDSVTELNPDGSVAQTIPVGASPVGIWSDGVRVWVANYYGNSVTELNASDGSLVRTIPVGNAPAAVASDGIHVWVANYTDNTVTELNAADTSLLAPGEPASLSGVASDSQVALNWSAPASDGGSAITDYAVSVFNSSGGPATGVTGATTRLVGSTTTNLTFTGLTNETAYTFRVAALNAAGTGAQSAFSSLLTPFVVPGAPTGVSGTSGNGQVALSWSAPTDNGGSAITDYSVSVFDSGGGSAPGVTGSTTRLVGSASTSYTFTGLTNAIAYTFKVAAVNAAGGGAPSALSAPVTASSFTVPALVPNPGTSGFDTGYTVNNSATIGASGSWCPDATPADCVGADGSGGAAPIGSLLAGGSGAFALVGRIGTTGPWTLIGSGPATLNGHGELYLAMNDVAGTFGDNTGALQVSVAALDGVSGTTPPVSAQITSGYDATWLVPIINESGVAMTGVSATLHANANGPAPRGFHTALMPGCTSGAGSSLVCTIGTVPAHTTVNLNVYVPTTGLATGRTVTGDIDVSATGQPDALGTLGTVTVVSCGPACTEAAATPGVEIASPAPTAALPTQVSVALPADVAGTAPQPGVAVTLQTIDPTAATSAGDRQLCPVTGTAPRCSGQISVVNGDFTKFTNKFRPVQVKLVTKWPGAVPAGKILMLKPTGPPVQLPKCVLNFFTGYNTPCLRSEKVTGTPAGHNVVSTDTILFVGTDPHFSRRVVTTPDAPTALTAVAGPTSATVHWKAPAVTNGTITGYAVTAYVGTLAQKTMTFAGTATSGAITGLTAGKSYTFKAIAKNALGSSYLSIATTALIVGTPAAPTGVVVTVTAGVAGGTVTVHWATPGASADNGALITGYVITPYKAGVAQPAKSFGTTPSTATLTGLTPGATYTFRVAAKNIHGVGAFTTSQSVTITTA